MRYYQEAKAILDRLPEVEDVVELRGKTAKRIEETEKAIAEANARIEAPTAEPETPPAPAPDPQAPIPYGEIERPEPPLGPSPLIGNITVLSTAPRVKIRLEGVSREIKEAMITIGTHEISFQNIQAGERVVLDCGKAADLPIGPEWTGKIKIQIGAETFYTNEVTIKGKVPEAEHINAGDNAPVAPPVTPPKPKTPLEIWNELPEDPNPVSKANAYQRSEFYRKQLKKARDRAARKAGGHLEGRVQIEFDVNGDGTISGVKFSCTIENSDICSTYYEPALRSLVSQMKFAPPDRSTHIKLFDFVTIR
ncbi:MAG: hypothetical protein HYY44_05315 [Deltaproteobacteria bacterium]|nr:hypothetical protein [Deltaproteobacteria bacterium]